MNLEIDYKDKEDIDEKMYDEGRPIWIAAVANITEVDAGQDGADGFQFGFEEMGDHEGHHLD